jgi:hypothetical protein
MQGGCGCGVPLPLKKGGYRLTAGGYRLTAGGYRLTAGGYRLTAGGYRLTAGGYRSTKRDRQFLRLWKKGKSIGFTMRSSLKAKGLIPRSNGTRKISPKYR